MPPIPPASIGSLVVMGDSFTEGLEDDLGATGRHLGWADRVAAALATRSGRVRYANLAVRGRLLDQVVDEQLPVAVALQPDLATFHAGPNDVLRPRTDVADVLRRYDRAVGSLTAGGVPTLLFTVIERAGGTGRTAARLAARFGAFNAGVRASRGAPWSAAGRSGCGDRHCTTGGSGTRTGCTWLRKVMRGWPPACSRRWASATRRCWRRARLVAGAVATGTGRRSAGRSGR